MSQTQINAPTPKRTKKVYISNLSIYDVINTLRFSYLPLMVFLVLASLTAEVLRGTRDKESTLKLKYGALRVVVDTRCLCISLKETLEQKDNRDRV